jgi:hypothetical protein
VKSLESLGNLHIKILDCKPVGDDKVSEIFEIRCDPNKIDDVVKYLESSDYVDGMEILDVDKRNGVVLGVVRTSHCTICRLFSSSSECFLGTATYEVESNCIKWRLISHMGLIADIMDRLRDDGVDISIDSVTSIRVEDDAPELTYKQEEILSLAWKLGLFDFPRRITISELAKMLNLSPATVTESLRASLKKILRSYFNSSNEVKMKK